MNRPDVAKPVIGEVKEAEDDNKVVTKASTLKKNKTRKFKQLVKTHPLRSAIALLLIVIVVGAVLWINEANNKPLDADSLGKPEDPAVTTARVAKSKTEANLRDGAEKLIVAGNLAQADANYDAAVNSETDTINKIKLYLDLSAVYYKHDNFAKTIAVANKASALTEDQFLVADWLSRVYEDKSNFSQAANYYLLAAHWADSPQNDAHIKKADYEAEASRVQGLAK